MHVRYLSLLAALAITHVLAIAAAEATTEKYRLAWRDDPATTVVIAWHQKDGMNPVVHFGPQDHGQSAGAYPHSMRPHHALSYRGMNSQFARLTRLKPDTAYYFVIKDSNSTSRRLWFRTAPDKPKPFTFIAGGDSRSNAQPRREGNRLVAKLRPLFICHGGDYMGSGTSAEWQQWFDEWQLTISPDGRIYPLIPTHGNHENNDPQMVHKLFDTANQHVYGALDIGGRFMRVYTLNTEVVRRSDVWQAQREWFARDLARHQRRTWKIVQYHRPMRAHTRAKPEGIPQIKAWAHLLYDHGVDLAIECDTHMVKRTYPLRPSNESGSHESFIRDDKRGTVFIGEGSWGAPKRPANDDKPWTMASDSFYQFKWIHVTPEHIDIRSVKFEDVPNVASVAEDDPLAVPAGLRLWEPETGAVLRLPFNPYDPTFSEPAKRIELLAFGSTWRYHDAGDTPARDWHAVDYDDARWESGPAPLGYGNDGEVTKLSYGGNPTKKHAAYYFRTRFDAATKARKTDQLVLEIAADDGFVAYLNGREIGRANMPAGPITARTFACRAVGDAPDARIKIDPARLRAGRNVLAVEVHQANASSSDIHLDAAVVYESR